MTLSDTHSLNDDGLKDLHRRLQILHDQPTQHWFVVVIPKGYGIKKFKDNPVKKQQEQFRFFTMELELDAGMCPFLS